MLASALLAAALTAPASDAPKPFEFKDGDRIVWLGNTLVEREQRYGYWETELLAANADKNITLRNLGWSGDTVFGDARAGFDNAAKGFERMVSLALQPQAIDLFVGLGMGPAVPRLVKLRVGTRPTVIFVSFGTNEAFEGKEGLPKFEQGLEKLLDALKPANARVVLFSPMRFYKSNSLPDPKPMNANLALYRDAIRAIAEKRGHYFADLYQIHPDTSNFTDNGMHLNEKGYELTAVSFRYALGHESARLSAEKLEPLRKAVVAKNELFFHRWRPQNETYLFGFRQHEQGRNAKEIVEFDPLVMKAEEDIAKLLKELKK